jgi:hypothetical protein
MPEFMFEMETTIFERAIIKAESVEKAWDLVEDGSTIHWEHVSGKGGDITLADERTDKKQETPSDE